MRFRLSTLFVAIALVAFLMWLLRVVGPSEVVTYCWMTAMAAMVLTGVVWLMRRRKRLVDFVSSQARLCLVIVVVMILIGATVTALSIPCFPRRITIDYKVIKFERVAYPGHTPDIHARVRFQNLSGGYIWYCGCEHPVHQLQFLHGDPAGRDWTIQSEGPMSRIWTRLAPGEFGFVEVEMDNDSSKFTVGMRFARWNHTIEMKYSEIFFVDLSAVRDTIDLGSGEE